MQIKKVVIIGPESTGKSTLSKLLAAHFNCLWVSEYAREYLEKNGKNYAYEDLYEIAMGQLKAEETLTAQTKNNGGELLIIDTDLHVMKVWSEFVYNKCDNRILTAIAKRSYDLYLLCGTDLPWTPDELREYPDLSSRNKLYHHYRESLIEQKAPWFEISGDYEERLQLSVGHISSLQLIDNKS